MFSRYLLQSLYMPTIRTILSTALNTFVQLNICPPLASNSHHKATRSTHPPTDRMLMSFHSPFMLTTAAFGRHVRGYDMTCFLSIVIRSMQQHTYIHTHITWVLVLSTLHCCCFVILYIFYFCSRLSLAFNE